MAALSRLSVGVVGSGVLGLAVAFRLAQARARVVLYDPSPLADSASAVAAGMLAPAFEAGLDPAAESHFPLLRQARDRWPDLLAAADAEPGLLDRSGGLFVGSPAEADALQRRLAATGARAEPTEPDVAARLALGLRLPHGAQAVFTPEDWRLSPVATLAALRAAYLRRGGEVSNRRVRLVGGGLVTDDGPLSAEVVVIAAGAEAAAFDRFAPELAVLQPIKGQILHFAGGPAAGPVVRTPRGYVAPQAGGAVVGATMEPGLSDRRTDPAALAALRAEAERLFPDLARVEARGLAGVRAATPDGLPLVGRSAAAPHVVLCGGARRNGWLLAPLVAELVAATLAGEETGGLGARLAPGRFTTAQD